MLMGSSQMTECCGKRKVALVQHFATHLKLATILGLQSSSLRENDHLSSCLEAYFAIVEKIIKRAQLLETASFFF